MGGHSQRSNTLRPIVTCIRMCEIVLLLLSGKSESAAAASIANGMSSTVAYVHSDCMHYSCHRHTLQGTIKANIKSSYSDRLVLENL